MRAIAGILAPSGLAPDKCRSMLAAMAALPPQLALEDERVALGFSDYRPPDSAGNADLPSEATTVRGCVLVADVRLDNRDDLCSALGLSRDTPNTAILANAWLRWDTAMVEHLLGGFAFACWDLHQRSLFLARDHAGERPLHFARLLGGDGGFAFASLPPGLCALPSVGHTVDVEFLARLLAVVPPRDGRSCFRGVERLLPGHWLKVTPEATQMCRYWHPVDAKPLRYRRDSEYIDDFRERFDRAVGARLAGGVGVASELSGGMDSSSVAATAARLLASDGQRLTAFTAVPVRGYDGTAMPGRFGDEGPAAAEVAGLYPNIDHVLLDTSGRDLLEASARTARLTGQPTFNPTNQLWVDAILDGARSRGLGVLLQGACGNATISFGGLVGLSDLFRQGRWFALLRQTRELRARGHTSWRGAASWATGSLAPAWLRRLVHPEIREFSFDFSPVHPDRAAEYGLQEKVLEDFYGADESSAALRRQLYEYFDPGVTNGAAAAGWQVEQRDPTQDKRIYEFCFSIPIEQYLVGGQSRSLVRRAMHGRLPASTLERTTRGLQAADWYLVMGAQRARLAAELTRIEQSPLARHLIDVARMRRLLDSWPTTGLHQPKVNDVWHLALSRGIAAGSFLAAHDPAYSGDAMQPADTTRPGTPPGLAASQSRSLLRQSSSRNTR